MRVQFGKLIRESKTCVVCGVASATTREHIPPRSIFLKAPPAYLVVPACKQCNETTKRDDEYLRHVMTAASGTPEALELWSKKVAAKFHSFPATRVGLKNRLATAPIRLPGLGVVPVRVLLAEAERINRVTRKMVRGLFWFHNGERLSDDVPIHVQMWNSVQLAERFNDPQQMAVLRKTALGAYRDPEVMRSFFYQGAIEGHTSLWYFFFYRQNALVAYTGSLEREGMNHESRHPTPSPTSYRTPPGRTERPRRTSGSLERAMGNRGLYSNTIRGHPGRVARAEPLPQPGLHCSAYHMMQSNRYLLACHGGRRPCGNR